MADNADNAETRNVARLDFNIDKAKASLTELEKKLETISKKSEEYAKNIGLAINNGVDYKSIAKSIGLSEKELHKLTMTAQKEAIITREERERQEIKTTETLKRQHIQQEKSVQTLYDKISKYAGTYLIYQGFNKLKQGISDVIDEMVNMEQQMVAIDRVMNVTGMDINKFRDDLIQLAYDYGNSFNNVADVSLRLAQAGIKEQENLALTEKTLLALNTAELNATEATDDMVAIMSQWNLITDDATQTAKEYGSIIDKVNKVADNYPTTSADILDALKKVSSGFNLAGASIDETIALIVAAEKTSQRGGKAIGTALGNITQQLKESKKLGIAESLGLNFFTDETKTEFKGIVDIFTEMSTKMQELKDAGKENSVEMQNLLSIFTVFRRNIGASLLGEMSGEDSTYFQVLNDSLTATGYSLQENEKYLGTVKAAQEQFNVSLLQLKTEVWDSGVEDVYKSMLILGKELVGNIGLIVKQFGGLPTIVGAVTLAFSLFSKQMKIAKLNTETQKIELNGLAANLKKFIVQLKATDTSMLRATARTLALKAATIGLNLAASAAATAGMMLLTSIIQELINKEAAAIQLQESSIQSTEKQVNARQEEISSLEDLIKLYDDLGTKTDRTPEETTRLYEIQVKIKDILGEQADTIDLINGKYNEEKQKLDKLTQGEKEKLLAEKERLMWQKRNADVQYELPSIVKQTFGGKNYEDVLRKYGGTEDIFNNQNNDWDIYWLKQGNNLSSIFENSTIEEAIELLTTWEKNLRNVDKTSDDVKNTYNWVNETLNKLKETTKESDMVTQDYYKTLAGVDIGKMFPEGSIKNAEEYKMKLEELRETYGNSTGDMKVYGDTLLMLFQEKFPQFAKETKNLVDTTKEIADVNKSVISDLEGLSQQYSILQTAENELNQTGDITVATFKNLIEADGDLLNYLDVVNGQIIVNTESMEALAEETKIQAIESLKAAASEDIHKLALGQEADMSETAKNAIAKFGDETETAGNKSRTAAGKILELASSIAQVIAANSELAGDNNVKDFEAKAAAISNAYQSAASKIGAITISPASSSRSGSSGSSSRSYNSVDREREKEEKERKKQEEEEYKKRLDKFTENLDKMEEKEQAWVKKQKALGQLSNKDMLYVTEQRITKYTEYLNEIKKATWMNTEDRKKLQEEYTKKLKESQLDYFEYLKGKLDDEVKAIEKARDKELEKLEKENDKKKKLIEKEADARIAALKKVSKQRDRDREKQDYEKNKKEITDEIAYWQQRTGREATEKLAEAKKKLEELNKDWKEKNEDWKTEDEIEKIEKQRDKALKKADKELKEQQKQVKQKAKDDIAALKKTYKENVKAFSKFNKIIYDDNKITSKKLYKTYKTNFVDPLKKDFKNIGQSGNSSNKKTDNKDTNKKYVNYTVKKGDTLESIAKKYNTTVKKIEKANSSIKDGKIKKGQTIKIPQFHTGGIFSGTEEGLALLKKGEWVLKPEWSNSLNRMMKYFDNITQGRTETITNSSTIEVEGNLVNIQANVRNQTDIDAIGQKIEKILKDKFNIKK